MQNLNICCLLFTLNFIIKYFYPISHKIFNMFNMIHIFNMMFNMIHMCILIFFT